MPWIPTTFMPWHAPQLPLSRIVYLLAGEPNPQSPAYLDKAVSRAVPAAKRGFSGLGSLVGSGVKQIGESYGTGKRIMQETDLPQRLKEAWQQQNLIRGLIGEDIWRRMQHPSQ